MTETQTEAAPAAQVHNTIAFQSDSGLSLMERIMLKQARALEHPPVQPRQSDAAADQTAVEEAGVPQLGDGALLAVLEDPSLLADTALNFVNGTTHAAPADSRHNTALDANITITECTDADVDEGEESICVVEEPPSEQDTPALATSRPTTRQGIEIQEWSDQ